MVEKVEVVRVGKARRAKLNYLRDRIGKEAKTKEKVGARIENKVVVLKEAIDENAETIEETVETAEVIENVETVETTNVEKVENVEAVEPVKTEENNDEKTSNEE